MMSFRVPGSLKMYTGYIREVFTYTTFILRPKRRPRKKFVIFTVGRTGSNLLVSLLDSHPGIKCHGELLFKRVLFPQLYLKCQERLSSQDIYGFKIIYYNFGVQKVEDPLEILNELSSDGYKIISLKRRNVIRQTISHMYALHRQTFHEKEGQAKKSNNRMIIDLNFFQQELEYFLDHRSREEQLLKNFSYLQLYYEDDLLEKGRHQCTMDKIASYLGIPNARVTSDFGKTTPQELSNVIENYEEFKRYLEQTEYYQYLFNE
jgi:hypothetical protein